MPRNPLIGRERELAAACDLLRRDSVLRTAADMSLGPAEQAEYDQELSAARARLDIAAFDAAWRAGQVMTIDQAMELAMSSDTSIRIDQPPIRAT